MVEAQRIRKGREEGCLETARGYSFRDPAERPIVAAILIAPPRPPWVIRGDVDRRIPHSCFRYGAKTDFDSATASSIVPNWHRVRVQRD